MCLAAFYSFAYSHCKVSITELDQSRRFLLLSDPLIFNCQHPAHSSLRLSELTSLSEGGRMVHMEESGQVVSKLTFRNVSCFVFVAFGLAQRSAAFLAVRKHSPNKNQNVKGRRLGCLCYCYRQDPFSVLL